MDVREPSVPLWLESQVRGLPFTGTEEERESFLPPPDDEAESVALANLKPLWLNPETNWLESYFEVTGTAGLTVPGLVAGSPSGWYPVSVGPVAQIGVSSPQAFSSAGDFVNWSSFGTGLSHRTVGDDWFTYASGRLIVHKPGRYRASGAMQTPVGTGTGYVSLRSYLSGGTLVSSMLRPAVLNATFTTGTNLELPEILFVEDQYLVFRSDQGSWSLGNSGNSFMRLEYVGPPLSSL